LESSNEVWGVTRVGPGASVRRVVGSLTVTVRREPTELWLSGEHVLAASTDPTSWIRWSVPPGDELELRPVLPDRALVVSPERPFFLPPEAHARVYVRVPLFVRLVRIDEEGRYTVLGEFPSLVLSDTWWGTFTDGELAYWMTTTARRTVTPEIFEPHLAISSLWLMNRSEEPLPVERFALRTSHLTLFGRAVQMWTDEVQVRYEASEEGSEISYTGRVPEDAGRVERVAAPREEPPRGFHAKTFGRLRALSGLG
jgi:hypothetical protein